MIPKVASIFCSCQQLYIVLFNIIVGKFKDRLSHGWLCSVSDWFKYKLSEHMYSTIVINSLLPSIRLTISQILNSPLFCFPQLNILQFYYPFNDEPFMFLLYSKDFLIRKGPKKCKCCLSVCVFLIVPDVFIRDL